MQGDTNQQVTKQPTILWGPMYIDGSPAVLGWLKYQALLPFEDGSVMDIVGSRTK